MLKIASLFSGIGGLEYGLEAAGLGPTVAQVEIDPYCQQVLEKHWPAARRYLDVKQVSAADLGGAQLYCGGFPCTDVSRLNREGRGLSGERSGLWSEFARLIGEGRPEWVVIENVAALVSNGLAIVLGDLAALGYNAWWDCIPASAVGAPHKRERVFIIARLADAHGDVLVKQRRGVSPGQVAWRHEQPEGTKSADSGRARAGAARRADKSGLDRYADGLSEGLDPNINAKTQDANSNQALRDMQGSASAEAQRERLRRLQSLFEKEVLQYPVFQPKRDQPKTRVAVQKTSQSQKRANAKSVPDMRHCAETTTASYRPRHNQQYSRQSDDPLCVMPYEVALGARVREEAEFFSGFPSRPFEALAPWEPPRSAEPHSHWRERHRAIGNAVVPQIAYMIGCAIQECLK